MRPVTDLPNSAGGVRVAALNTRAVDKGPASTPEPCDATHNFDTRRGHGPQGPRSSALAGALEPSGGRSGSKLNSVGGRTRGAGKTRRATLRLDAGHHGDKHFADRTPLGTRGRRGLQISNTDACGHVCTSFPDRTLRDERGTRPTGRILGQKARTLTQRYGTQFYCSRHLQGCESRRNTGKQLDTCDSPGLEERGTENALRGDGPTWGGGLWQDLTQLGRYMTRRY